MYVCICNSVTDGDIREAVDEGISTLDELRDELKVSSCCGRCADCARDVLHQALANLSFNEPLAEMEMAAARAC